MRYAGAFVVIGYVAAWTALFGRHFIGCRDKTIIPRTVLLALVGPVGILTLGWTLSNPVFFVAIPGLLIAPLAAEAVLLARPARRTFLPLLAFLSTLIASGGLIRFCHMAYRMWAVYRGSARYEEMELAGFHVLLILGMGILGGNLIFQSVKAEHKASLISAVASLVYVVSVGIAFVMTIPRGGDWGGLVWLYIVPVFAAGALLLFGLSLSVLFTALSYLRSQRTEPPPRNLQPSGGSLKSEGFGDG